MPRCFSPPIAHMPPLLLRHDCHAATLPPWQLLRCCRFYDAAFYMLATPIMLLYCLLDAAATLPRRR